MKLDRDKPFGEIYGPSPVEGARFEQNGHYFDASGYEINPENLSPSTLDVMEGDEVREYVERTFPDEKIDKRFGKDRLIQWVRERNELASTDRQGKVAAG